MSLQCAYRRKFHIHTTSTSPSNRYASNSSAFPYISSNIIRDSHMRTFANEKRFEQFHIHQKGLEENKY
jgi:hypothetical protein